MPRRKSVGARPVNLRNVAREGAAFTEAQPQDESIVEGADAA
jgi:hypothetical protein